MAGTKMETVEVGGWRFIRSWHYPKPKTDFEPEEAVLVEPPGAYRVFVDLRRTHDGAAVPIGVRVLRKFEGRGVTIDTAAERYIVDPRTLRISAREVRRLPLAKIIDAAIAVANKPKETWTEEAGEAVAPAGRPERGKSTRFYQEVADSWRDFTAEHKSPVKEIARRKRVPENTVHQWVYRARQLGFLEPSTRGNY